MSINEKDFKKAKKKHKFMKVMSSVALFAGMTGAVVPAVALTNNAISIHAEEQANNPTITINGFELELPCTIYVVDYYEAVSQEDGYITGQRYSNIRTIELDSAEDVEYIQSLRYVLTTDQFEDYDDNENYVKFDSYQYSNQIYTGYHSGNKVYTGLITPPKSGSYYTAVYDAGDNYAPVVDGQLTYITSPFAPVTIDTIIANLRIVDNVDGEISNENIVVVSNEYTGNESVLGDYTIVLNVTDTAGNTATCNVLIMVQDLEAPAITGPISVDAYISKNLTIDDFKSLLSVSDDIDALTKDDIVVKEDNFTANKNVPGTYNVIFFATDTAGNETTHTMSVVVKDDIKPTITGTDGYTKGSTDVQMTLDGMLNNLSVNDNVSILDKSNLNIVSDTYSGNEGKVGTYKVVVNITDEAGNTSDNFTITIVILDDVAPVFWANNSFYVHVDGAVALSNTQLAYIARSLGIVDNTKDASVQIISNEYEGNESTKGEYIVSVLAVYEDGTQNTGSFTLSVDSDFNDAVIIPADEEPLKWYEKAWNGIKWFFSFKWLTTPLKWIWNHIVEPIWEALKWLGNKLF